MMLTPLLNDGILLTDNLHGALTACPRRPVRVGEDRARRALATAADLLPCRVVVPRLVRYGQQCTG